MSCTPPFVAAASEPIRHPQHHQTPAGGAAAAAVPAPDPCTIPLPSPTLGLLDMPAPWLDQLVQIAATGQWLRDDHTLRHQNSLLPLFASCTSLRDMVILQRVCVMAFVLPMHPDAAAAAQAKLLLACQRSPRIKLKLSVDLRNPPDVSLPAHVIAANLMCGAMMAAAGGGLTAIKNVELQNLRLDALVPHWLTFTCPHMTSLTLDSCHLRDMPATAVPICNQLQELHLKHITVPVEDYGQWDSQQHQLGRAMEERWREQFRALTGLTSLNLAIGFDNTVRLLSTVHPVIGTQITRFRDVSVPGVHVFPGRGPGNAAYATIAATFPLGFPNLRVLELPNVMLDDGGVEAVLGLQHVTRLHAGGFCLQQSYRDRPCPWKHLTFDHLSIASFDCLALDGIQSLQVTNYALYVYPGSDLGTVRRVASVFTRVGRVTWGSDTGDQHVFVNTEPGVGSAHVAAILPIVAAACRPQRLVVQPKGSGGVMVTPELLGAFKQHLSGTTVTKITLVCTVLPDMWAVLLPSLPPIDELIMCAEGATEAQVIEACVHACRPIKVLFDSYGLLDVGWEKRVQASMAAAGHQHVKLR